ncbi:MAG: hypothetical protein RJA07_1539 [Bacteroidota bacterium]
MTTTNSKQPKVISLLEFENFAKGSKKQSERTNNCVIYTRVSTKEQADKNMSLTTQKKFCDAFAQKNQYNVSGYFGGTYESAKTDERKEFNNMLAFVKKSKEKISTIIVYSVDRFSRSGANAIYITEQLKKQGVSLMAVTQPTDTTTSSGSLQQNIQFIFSEYDNQLRREKCMSGTKEMLLRGDWATKAPRGYDHIKSNGKRIIVVNKEGKHLRKAFHWFAEDRLSVVEITNRLNTLGIKVCHQRVSQLFRNPFYCGLMAHKALEGQLTEGNHEKLISKELFLKVNAILNNNNHGYKQTHENEQVPLKRFLRCQVCGTFMRGYIVKNKNIWYYKCGKKGCGCNKNATQLHQLFSEQLQSFTITAPKIEKFITKQIVATYKKISQHQEDNFESYEQQKIELQKKLDRLEERFINEELSKELFDKHHEKISQELKQIEKELLQRPKEASNLESMVQFAVENCSQLATIWSSGDYNTKQKLQYLVFPEGIYYSKENNECRTDKLNPLFSQIAQLKQISAQKNSGNINDNYDVAASVVGTGVEPVTSGL